MKDNISHAEFISCKHKIHLHFVSFLNTDATSVVVYDSKYM